MKYFVVLNEIECLLKAYKATGNGKCLSAIILTHAADAIEELQKPKWIPVTERLPNYGEKCLVVRKLHSHNDFSIGVSYCYVQKEGFFSDTGRDWRVTHWMPLPEPPNGDEDIPIEYFESGGK